ncbi:MULTISPECIES: DUF488 family protein [unclassified Natrinema]|uniref:DUF488 family protein, N3 subclade n=1 Tax=unclassified Natrinema TaxID=2622230 RepID=UPI000AD9BFC5
MLDGRERMARGTLTDTSVRAIRHGLAAGTSAATRIGVLRRPPSRARAVVDETVPELGLPDDLLASMRDAAAERLRGLCDEGADNAGWERVGVGEAYRNHLETDADARPALAALDDRLAAGESFVLVCVENTETKRCHRTILRAALEGAESCRRSLSARPADEPTALPGRLRTCGDLTRALPD